MKMKDWLNTSINSNEDRLYWAARCALADMTLSDEGLHPDGTDLVLITRESMEDIRDALARVEGKTK